MTQQKIIEYCLAKTGAYIDYPFGPEVTIIKVKSPSQNTGRIFAQIFELKGEPFATFNCDRITGEFYRQTYPKTVMRGYHCPPVQQPYFNTIKLDNSVSDNEILQMINHSYKVVVGKMPKYIQKELFNTYQKEGEIDFSYDTELIIGDM